MKQYNTHDFASSFSYCLKRVDWSSQCPLCRASLGTRCTRDLPFPWWSRMNNTEVRRVKSMGKSPKALGRKEQELHRIMLIKLWMCLKMCLVGQGRLGWLSLGVTCKRWWLWAETRAPCSELQQVGAYQQCSSLASSKLLNCCNSKLPGASNSCSKPVSWQEESPRDQTNTVRSQPGIVLLIIQV